MKIYKLLDLRGVSMDETHFIYLRKQRHGVKKMLKLVRLREMDEF
jgi:hypothetical protein